MTRGLFQHEKHKQMKKIGLVILPVLLVAGLRLWALSRQVPYLDKIAAEIGSIPQYRVGIYANHSGSSLIFFRETETGLGTYLCETATGKTHLLFEEAEKGYSARFRLLGWSEDDAILIFAAKSDSDAADGSGTITICKGATGEVITNLPASAYASDSQFAWLSRRSFVYSTFSHRSWLLYAEKPDGSWEQTQVVKRFTDGRLPNLIGTSPHSIAWRNKQAVWSYDFASKAMNKIWEAESNSLTGLAASASPGFLLLNCKDGNGPYQAELQIAFGDNPEGRVVRVIRPPPVQPKVDVRMKGGKFIVEVAAAPGPERVGFEWEGMMHYYDGALHYYDVVGDDLFFVGSPKDGLPGVWNFNIKTKNIRPVTAPPVASFKWAKLVKPTAGMFTNRNGVEVSYHVWPPVNKSPGRGHPLIIRNELHIWNPFQQAAANSGCFYAKMDDAEWNSPTWAEDVEELINVIGKNHEIDPTRVIFISTSAQSQGASRLSANKPEMAHGLIFYHPGGLMSVSNVNARNFLIFGGTDDKNETLESLVKLNDEAFNNGQFATVFVQDGVQHVTRSVKSEREQTVQFARFLDRLK
jgi:hypothetical protein